MNAQEIDEMKKLHLRVTELETIIKAHRALISQHHSALQTVAQIMEQERNVHPIP